MSCSMDPRSMHTCRRRTSELYKKLDINLNLFTASRFFDSFLNNLTSYALAARPSKAIGSAHMSVSVLLGKTRGSIVNEHIAKRTKSLSRENFGTRIQALRDISGADFKIPKDYMDDLKRLSNLRNTIVHEGAAFQFTVDDDLHIHSEADHQTIDVSPAERFDSINPIAACIYEQYVTKFVGRDLNDIERSIVDALSPPEERATLCST